MIATTLEQSRKLVELGISADTADMHYAFSAIGGAAFQDMIDASATLLPENYNRKYSYEPAWSLNALLDLIPKRINDYQFCIKWDGDVEMIYYVNKERKLLYFENTRSTHHYSPDAKNLLDATFEMVCWLKENKYI